MKRKIKLKPCPFCGTVPTVERTFYAAVHYVRCYGDKCTVQPSTAKHELPSTAARAWNRRAKEKP